ncbi:phosphoribosyl diphosphate synthase [Talaromyces proteolyticus]|uniref:ribose-phosphate diphosphokinase n=1 Tax=Talaromyces proteolyticus TaxID=1131652 RepID=A0AAD4KKP6_9EURO|nr:phosphoribosyl diphosphate synthase [Talaromyces proteolyticus]KAH8693208.1 phosphoribosyl diphosphate synthase [Talaromyces proteolyticus]
MAAGLRLLSGSSYRELAQLVTKRIGYPLSAEALHISRFSNGETFVSIEASVRGADVFIIQTASDPVNDMLMELLIAVSACKMASARSITAVMPCYPYARQDRKDRSRAPITAKLVATMLESAGCNHIITMDLHASQIQGFFNIPVDKFVSLRFARWGVVLTCKLPKTLEFRQSVLTSLEWNKLYAEKTVIEYIQREFEQKDLVLVSPDAGGAKRAATIADHLQVDLAIIHKERKVANKVSRMILVGDVKNKIAIIVDDIADTCGTLASASKILKEHGAQKSIAIVTHGFLSGPSVGVIESSDLERLVVANTLPLPALAKSCAKIQQVDISPIIAEAIRRTHNGESISMLFN